MRRPTAHPKPQDLTAFERNERIERINQEWRYGVPQQPDSEPRRGGVQHLDGSQPSARRSSAHGSVTSTISQQPSARDPIVR